MDQTEALLDSKSKVIPMNQVFAFQLGLKIWKTNIGPQKMNDTILKTYWMIVSTFSMLDKYGEKRFLKNCFVLAEIKPDIVFGTLFLIISNADINF